MENVLPKYMVLRAKYNGKYMHYLWNADEAKEYYQDMACKHDVDPVSPFAKLEVVPSTTNPSFVHLRCCYNNRFVKLDTQHGLPWLSAKAEAPEESLPKDASSSTLFQPLFKDDDEEPKTTIQLMHVQTKLLVRVYFNHGPKYLDRIQEVLTVESYGDRFEFAPWESYDEKMKAKDDEIKARDVEIRKLSDEVAVKEGENKELRDRVAEKDGEIGKLKEQVVEKDGVITKKTLELNAREKDVKELEAVVKEKEKEIGEKNGEIEATRVKTEKLIEKIKAAMEEFQA